MPDTSAPPSVTWSWRQHGGCAAAACARGPRGAFLEEKSGRCSSLSVVDRMLCALWAQCAGRRCLLHGRWTFADCAEVPSADWANCGVQIHTHELAAPWQCESGVWGESESVLTNTESPEP